MKFAFQTFDNQTGLRQSAQKFTAAPNTKISGSALFATEGNVN